jgi:hypothetical protein
MLHNRAESLEEYDVRGIGALAEDVESRDSLLLTTRRAFSPVAARKPSRTSGMTATSTWTISRLFDTRRPHRVSEQSRRVRDHDALRR